MNDGNWLGVATANHGQHYSCFSLQWLSFLTQPTTVIYPGFGPELQCPYSNS